MHELSLAQGLVTLVEPIAREHGAHRVRATHLRVGELTCVDPETLAFAFEAVARGTILEGSRLEVTRVPVRLACGACAWEGPGPTETGGCPACGSNDLTIVSGREIQVDSIDIED